MKFIVLGLFVVYMISPLARVIIRNLHLVGIYSFFDFVEYIKFRRWDDFSLYGIDMFIGMFGHGKTLSMTHRARLIYKKYGDKVRFISNYKLTDIPYLIPVFFIYQPGTMSHTESLTVSEHSDEHINAI